jgi:hypothetical protein
MLVKKLQLDLTNSIETSKVIRFNQGLPPIESIRGLARELEIKFPERYNTKTVTNRLHRCNKNGIRYAPDNLINDISTILMIDKNELVRKPLWFKKGTVEVLCRECNTLRTSFFKRLTFF